LCLFLSLLGTQKLRRPFSAWFARLGESDAGYTDS
jgi:hypothetical protein